MPYCKKCAMMETQMRVHKYYKRLTMPEKEKLFRSIATYYNELPSDIIIHYDERDIQRFIIDNYGDDTIIWAVTGFR